MTRRKVLVVCMFDSIHTGRWLSQFIDQEIDFTLFPSKKFKKIHPKLEELLISNRSATYSISHPIKIKKLLGYLDFIFFVQLPKILKKNLRALYLRRHIYRSDLNFVHALEIQGAGYLCDDAIETKNFKFILTNWGSDIFYFQHLEDHLPRIKSALSKADLYSAECQRDYKLAEKLGFKGLQLPCIPNGGGLVTAKALKIGIPTSLRKNIVVKTYGGTFGRGGMAIEAVAKALEENPDLTAYFYSVTEDLLSQTSEVKSKFGPRVSYSTVREPLSHEELEEIFTTSRIYVGCSISDGISTSFLEALTKGVYPIQTNTSCAGEWIAKGAIASLIPLELNTLVSTLRYVITNTELLDTAGITNTQLMNRELDQNLIKQIALKFYN